MKRFLILIGACLVISISQNVNLKTDFDEGNSISLTLTNIEVLANSEDPDKICKFIGSVDCPNSEIKVLYIHGL